LFIIFQALQRQKNPGFISVPPCCYFLLPWLRHHLVSGAVRITHVAVTSLFPARQPYLAYYKTLSRQKFIAFLPVSGVKDVFDKLS
jgi:hypothetical protein